MDNDAVSDTPVTIEKLMYRIINIDGLPVFETQLIKTDHTMGWDAVATLRASNRGFEYHGNTAIEALNGLYALLLDQVTCPHCGQRMSKKEG